MFEKKEGLIKKGILILTQAEYEDLSCSKCNSVDLKFIKKIEVACNCKFALKKTKPYLLLECLSCKQKYAVEV